MGNCVTRRRILLGGFGHQVPKPSRDDCCEQSSRYRLGAFGLWRHLSDDAAIRQ